FARADDVPVDMGALLKESMTPYGGRGGGRPHMAQGGGVDAADLTKVLDTARRRLAAEEGF
ncbi:MAG: DHHA1 domain-containing protein, partial [Anaerolineae bacterium]